jgi:alpha-ketoglutarate-dependent taurine dioxygenase
MDVLPLGPGFAAELRGVTLADVAANAAVYEAARAAFERHSVIVLRDQQVTDEAQIAFSRRFGPLEVTPVATEGAGTNLVILTTIGKDGTVVPAARSRPTSSALPSVRRCRRSAGAWYGRIRRTGAARFTSLRTLTRSKGLSKTRRRTCSPN